MRALIAYSALRALRLITLIALLTGIGVFAAVWALAYYLSPWWWVFLVPLVLAAIVATIIRFIITKAIQTIHRHPFTEPQRQALEAFTDKITKLAEFRSTPLPIYAFITLRDVVRHHDATTLRQAIEDSASLKSDFAALEKYFGER